MTFQRRVPFKPILVIAISSIVVRFRGAAHAGRAERSSFLWATVNVCDTPTYPNQIGVRGAMPSIGFTAKMSDPPCYSSDVCKIT